MLAWKQSEILKKRTVKDNTKTSCGYILKMSLQSFFRILLVIRFISYKVCVADYITESFQKKSIL